jgi:putative DNA primase/helicase
MNRTESALQFISSDDRDVWVSTGMAIKSEFGEAGFDIWNEWSKESQSYKSSAALSVWRSFRGTGISIKSLYHEAKLNGWRDEGFQKPTEEQIQFRLKSIQERSTKEGQERIKMAQEAAKKANWILDQCKLECHAYLHSKGYQDVEGLVWRPEQESNLLCIPMMKGHDVIGLQMIDKYGVKKFLKGQASSGSSFCMSYGTLNVKDFWVEGYASAMSLRTCLQALKLTYRIHVTFSANNLKKLATTGYVIADNDESLTGQKTAEATGLPYWISETVGFDINDQHKRDGTFKTSQSLGKWLRSLK